MEAPRSRSTTNGSRLVWVDTAKGLSILLVVLHHSVIYEQAVGLAPAPVAAANEALASLRMPLFFLASGLFVAGPLAAPWRTLLHKRVAFFLYLYLLWTVLRFTFFATLVPPEVDPNDSANPIGLAAALVLPGPSMWFLYALALFSVLGKLAQRVPVALQLGAAGVLSALTGAGMLDVDSRWAYLTRFLFFFLLGRHARGLIERVARSASPLYVGGAMSLCVGSAGGAVALGLRTVPGVALALNCVAVVFGVLFAAWISRHRIGGLLAGLGRKTLPIYLIHMLWLAAIMTGVRLAHLPPAAGYVLPVVLVPALVALSLLTHRLLLRAHATWLFALPSPLAYSPPVRAAGRHRGGRVPAAVARTPLVVLATDPARRRRLSRAVPAIALPHRVRVPSPRRPAL